MTGLTDPSTHLRSFRPDLQVRSGGDGRVVYGIAVPWRAPTRIDETLVEQFEPGAFEHQVRSVGRIKYAREHMLLGGTLVGALIGMRNDAAGQFVEMRVAKTPVGDETLELVRVGALPDLSVMFRERQNRRLAGGILARVTADLLEVASTVEGAYGELATVGGVRSAGAGTRMSTEDADLRAKAERYLGGLPDPPNHELTIRAIKLGMPI